ncbi:MAG: ArsR family transcriptional regulator [Candidatus Methanofastidiosa archaeon]|nr:ArsR family transcriptional regulator [Candidatus Methanofastidiosa archaeon]
MVEEDVLFNLLGNETRRLILKMLASGPCYTTEIADRLNVGQKAINEHMRLLQEAGLVDLFTQKQSRGSPRKYFRINKSVRLEFFVGPYRFDTSLANLIETDMPEVLALYPHLQDLDVEVRKTERIKEISQLAVLYASLEDEHEKVVHAKEYIEFKMDEVRTRCIDICDEIGLGQDEKRVVIEIVSAGGTVSDKELSTRLNVPEEEVSASLRSLEKKGLLKVR